MLENEIIKNEKSLNEFYKKFLLCNKNKINIYSFKRFKNIKNNYSNLNNIFKNDYRYKFIFNDNEKFFKIMLINENNFINYEITLKNINVKKLYDYLENENKLNNDIKIYKKLNLNI